jgi:cytosine/adenosine deaminase-related metal-dependent hydrolase
VNLYQSLHDYINSSQEAKTAISATASSGIRSIFGYCPTSKLKSWNPVQFDYEILAPWVLDTFTELATTAPFGNGRISIGLAFDLWFLPQETITSLFQKAKKLGVKTITTHCARNPQVSMSSLPKLIDSYGLLDDTILLSHGNGATDEDVALIKKANVHVSSTPSTELQTALGTPVCFREDLQSQCSLGIDCHSNNASSIPAEMRLALQSARGEYNAKFTEQGKAPRNTKQKVEDAFNLGTIQGARAIKMEDQIGSLAVGKLADLVIFDALSPAMICAAEHDPVAAIVLHSSPADIEGVMVDGIWRKKAGKLMAVQVEKEMQDLTRKERLEWKDVARALVKSRKVIQQKIEKLDFEEARGALLNAFHIDEANIVEKL